MISISSNQITVESKPIVEIQKNISFSGILGKMNVPYKIVCDLTKVPKEKHSIVIQTLMSI